ncbi:CLUMA_CG013517, isoform A [Clunio marinus]|uniref:CLUMA_CG013517, isoform A n=1 Tax=Clunio marinus TaxID=568069 RepID=A0A1J1IL11_9DIPT|nr:CLUMA_CG013517, isoform A [Clunio marinus]
MFLLNVMCSFVVYFCAPKPRFMEVSSQYKFDSRGTKHIGLWRFIGLCKYRLERGDSENC